LKQQIGADIRERFFNVGSDGAACASGVMT
jgi:hypothetical protein